MEAMEDENARNTQEIPSLESELSRLQTQLAEAQRKTRVLTCYKQADPESTVSLKKNENEGLSPSLLIAMQPEVLYIGQAWASYAIWKLATCGSRRP